MKAYGPLTFALGLTTGLTLGLVLVHNSHGIGLVKRIEPSKMIEIAKANEWVSYTEYWRNGRSSGLRINVSNGDTSTAYEDKEALKLLEAK